jgi:hypothetical protein
VIERRVVELDDRNGVQAQRRAYRRPASSMPHRRWPRGAVALRLIDLADPIGRGARDYGPVAVIAAGGRKRPRRGAQQRDHVAGTQIRLGGQHQRRGAATNGAEKLVPSEASKLSAIAPPGASNGHGGPALGRHWYSRIA